MWDKRKASMMDLEHTLVKVGKGGKEEVYTKSFETAFFVGGGGWGGPRGEFSSSFVYWCLWWL